MATKISWCDETINPVVGCSKISEGCQNCYAEKMARRLACMGRPQYQQVVQRDGADYSKFIGGWNGHVGFVPSELDKPYRWKRPRTIFVSSMGDLFHETARIKWQLSVLDMVRNCPQHVFIMLTKRPELMQLVVTAYVKQQTEVLPNLVLGVSVEDQQTANDRIPVLLKLPAAKRFVSLEPMIGPVDLMNLSAPSARGTCYFQCFHPVTGRAGLDGVILGGESGSKGRRLEAQWVMTVRDQCAAAGVPFMFKQWNHENRNEVDPDTGFPWLGNRTHSELAW